MVSPSSRGEVMALLADIKDNPREDGLRLILADWLEECGGPLDAPRADLIRAQIDESRLPIDDPAQSEAGRQARGLQQRHGKDWLGSLVDRLEGWTFERGLLSVNASVASLRAQSMRLLADTEEWAWVEQLFLVGCDDSDLAGLADSPLLTQLVTFGFQKSRVGPAGAQALAKLPWLERIEHVNLTTQLIGNRGLFSFLLSPYLGRLRELTLAGCGVGFEACEYLAHYAMQLERLTLSGNLLEDTGVRILSDGRLPKLRRLALRFTGLSDASARYLAATGGFPNLLELDLSDNQIGPAGAHALATSPYLSTIRSLVLWGNPVGSPAAKLLQDRFGSRVHVSPVPG